MFFLLFFYVSFCLVMLSFNRLWKTNWSNAALQQRWKKTFHQVLVTGIEKKKKKKSYLSHNIRKHLQTCILSKDSDQPTYFCSLISLHWVHFRKPRMHFFMQTTVCIDVQADMSLCWAHISKYFFHVVINLLKLTLVMLNKLRCHTHF